mgnify:FL=1
MLLYKLFSIKFFVAGLMLGAVLLAIYPSVGKTVTIYPSKENEKHIQYVDRSNSCFEFNVQEVECPSNPNSVKIIPIQ